MPPKKKGKGNGPLKKTQTTFPKIPPPPLLSREKSDDDTDDEEDIQDVVLSNP